MSFNLKVCLFVSLCWSMWTYYNIPFVDDLFTRSLMMFGVLFMATIQGLMVKDIGVLGGWRAENLFFDTYSE